TPVNDYGVDGTFRKVIRRDNHLFERGFTLDYQLKASTRWRLDKANVIYDLAAKNYNDLVLRPVTSAFPLLLLLVCLPADSTRWLECNEQRLMLRGGCYWTFVTGSV